jgi:NodT family efflux transporter outer membrane factor (OMF) lipoprotein
LDGLIEEAIKHNFNLKGAVARVDAAAAAARIDRADLLPGASLGFNASRRKQNLIGLPIPGAGDVISTRSTSMGVSLDVLWELDLWGRVRSGQAASLSELQASQADLAALRLSIAGQTAKAWFALVEAKLQLQLAEETVESYRISAEHVKNRYEQGVRSSLDLRLALSNLAVAKGLLEQRKGLLDNVTRQLEILLGRYPAASLEVRSAGAGLPKISAGVPAGLPAELLIRRPDLFAAERRYAAAEKRVSEARRAFFPRITLTASGGTLSQQLEDLVDGDFSVWSIAAGVTQPIFQGGRLRANLALSHAASDQALAEYASALLRAFGETESAFVAERILAGRETHAVEAAEQALAARRVAERQYQTGLIDYITYLETQRGALNSQSELISVRRQRLDARVNLYLALGGGFELNENWTSFMEQRVDTNPEASH